MEVFKVLSQERIQQHCTSSRPLTFQFQVVQEEGGEEVFLVFLDRVQQFLHLTLVLLMALGKVVFRTFPRGKKCGARSTLGVGTGCGLYSMDAGGLWRPHGG